MTFNDATTPLRLLATRRSGKARDLAAPGPDPAQLETIFTAASRVPDHGKLAPWRFVTITDRAALADLITPANAGRAEREAMHAFAHQAPTLVVMLFRPNSARAIPEWEQMLSAGAAAQNLILATHALGFAANWLTGPAAYVQAVAETLGQAGDRVVGFFFLGTPTKALEERPRPALADIVRRWPSAAAQP
ncbi:nitroreductase family protein [Sandaracinobacteroides saxicola]|uniref:Putative NAD(P)H nitroreductase n=1 Tax=Sandaracinobacteroides saxicola TaxID=2759707 RepID=A0A7G5IDV1_9SPHN|nr:nitroreductase [Sandaracinobacteroides saxicola]QMW21543.1 nitroreductase [Sandaracinobacteroides saxicola]